MSDTDLVPLGAMLGALENHTDADRALLEDAARATASVRSPGYVSEAERLVLGSILVDAKYAIPAIEEVGLGASDFHEDRHRHIFEVMVNLNTKGRAVDVVSVADALNRKASLGRVGGGAYLSKLASLTFTAASAQTHAKIVVEKSRIRDLAQTFGEGLERAKRGEGSADIVESTYSKLEKIERSRGGTDFVDLREATTTALNRLPVMTGGKIPGLKTGFMDLDAKMRFVPGDLIIVAARPSMGKTQLVIDFIEEISIEQRLPSAMFSLEMDAPGITTRMLASRSRLDLKRVQMPQHEIDTLTRVSAEISVAPIYIDESPSLTIADIRARARAAHRNAPLSLIVVDYLQLIDTPGDNREQEIAFASKSLKRLARELGCPVVALSQLNRGVESRANKRPMMSDLRESGAIEQDADIIVFVYREEYYMKDKTPGELVGVAELDVAKHRNGPTGSVMLQWEKDIPRFNNLSKGDWG